MEESRCRGSSGHLGANGTQEMKAVLRKKVRELRDELRLIDEGEGKRRNGRSQQSLEAKYLQRKGQHPTFQIRDRKG